MRRAAAAWRSRSREREHWPSMVVCVALATILSIVGYDQAHPWGAAAGLLGLALYVWGLWDEGGRLLNGRGTTYGRRR